MPDPTTRNNTLANQYQCFIPTFADSLINVGLSLMHIKINPLDSNKSVDQFAIFDEYLPAC